MTAPPEKSTSRTILAAIWMFGGRGLGLLWSLLVIKYLGISAFGQFAVGIAAASLISIPLDAYYLVRSPRVDDDQFRIDRASRWLIGVVLFAIGVGLFLVWLPAGLALSKAGGDIFFNAQKSTAIRAGKPDTAFALDSGRQGLSLIVGLATVLVLDDPSITLLSLVYVLAFIPFALLTLPQVVGVKVELPERSRRTVALVTEAVGGAAYSQGDIVLVGILSTDANAGYYSLASVVLWSIAAVGQNYSFTFHEPLREHHGNVAAGPPLKITAALALGGGLGMLGTGAVLWFLDLDPDLWLCFAILSVAATTRFFGAVFTTVLALQSRDELRARMSLVVVGIKTLGVLALGTFGSIGAAIAFVAADAIAFGWAYQALYRTSHDLEGDTR